MRKGTMKKLLGFLIAACIALPAFAQEEGDYRTRDSGDWSNAQIWERYNGSAWAAVATPPTGSETITVIGTEERTDSVFVDVNVSITGRLINQGIVDTQDSLTIADGGVYQHDRDEGKIPLAVWAEGSTLELTGTVSAAPEDRNQNYYNIIFNTPNQSANFNMDLNEATIGGDIRVVNTGLGRWYLTSALANDSSTVTIMGDVIVEDGAFAVHGTSNANTTFIVDHYGNIEVTGGNFSISRGSQGGGTTTWTLHEGNFSIANATTQNSTVTPDGAKFVFAKDSTQTLTIADDVTISALPIEVENGTTLDMGMSALGGAGNFTLNAGAILATAHPGGPDSVFVNVVADVVLEDSSGFEFNGTEAQITGERMPTTVSTLIIDNEAGVTLSQETTITDSLVLRAGVFDNTVPFMLAEGATIVEEGGSLLVPVADETENELPESFYVEQNYPNPFNPTTTIRYGLPSAADVTIEVFNALGQRVRTIRPGLQNAGVHEIILDAHDLSSGAYIYRVQAGDFVASRSMLVVK